ncbi:MAG: DNA-binding protein YbiB [Curvibacter sp. RIFCSPHIGHO2_12_FULL_63_18]|uniref:DNA-binding protein YbiB n=1 Tax=Rhodoferax sp. TaxID=50421 RepID=UPI0008C00A3C|nr:DNA-binding protein YbiB [Rhodoferax sp.]OGP01694.1 MAG: DNA-binding protein YbiB [Curvibacter sp. GWA2_63_95]OGP02862.1 MAG: DNA-binding protein YbiB [Curvibacter sp. RIFCSPHIGHO2_12_FULL_63_18]HCX83380.1 DNA-binding protein YbiB [Rhodoferax sp.]
MAIGNYIKEIGRGKDGARALTREQADDLFGQVLDGSVTDLEVGAFCLAMRIKGETAEEMAGFLDATRRRMALLPASGQPTVVIPSYNGARKLPLLTPLLALLLAREGLPVLIHGSATEDRRVFISKVLEALDIHAQAAIKTIAPGSVAFVPTALLSPGLQRLLDVRRVVNLRNPAHSLVKLMNPVDGPALIVSSYTHPEYAISMADTFALVQANALLIRGTEGESVADPRRTPKMQAFVRGQATDLQAYQSGALTDLPDLPTAIDAASTAAYIGDVLVGKQPLPTPIAQQLAHILQLHRSL